MCIDIGTALGIASAGLQIHSALSAGRDAQSTNDAQAGRSLLDARRALLDAQAVSAVAADAAAKTRILTREVVSTARARQGASGVNVNIGTARDVQLDIASRGEEDALNQVLLGERQRTRLQDEARAIEDEAGQFVQAGRNARGQGTLNAVSSAISAGADVYARWKSIQ